MLRVFVFYILLRPMTAVYIVGTGSMWGDCEELRYSLRSLERYAQGIDKVGIVGYCPAWCAPDFHIAADDIHRDNKEANIIEKMFTALAHPMVGEKVVFWHDDHFLLKTVNYKEWQPDHKGELWVSEPKQSYSVARNRTAMLLMNRNRGILNYDIHRPFVIDRTIFRNVMAQIAWRQLKIVAQSVYFNMAQTRGAKQVEDKKLQHFDKSAIGNSYFFSIYDSVLTPTFVQWMRKKYPKPSRYENQEPAL